MVIKSKLKFLGIIILITFAVLASLHEVDNSLTNEDVEYLPKYFAENRIDSKFMSYEDQIDLIVKIQNSVLFRINKSKGFPLNSKREPKELYAQREGMCYDRSRVIEKMLRFFGFKTRHIAIYSKENSKSNIEILLTPGIRSHAITEVLTKEGWIVVDSNNHWISLGRNNKPISIKEIQLSSNDNSPVKLKTPFPSTIYSNSFIFIYGLYSRHGYFYPPFNPIPDINYSELIQNFK
jgi:hypothetical protein